jgi:hypothetical protein
VKAAAYEYDKWRQSALSERNDRRGPFFIQHLKRMYILIGAFVLSVFLGEWFPMEEKGDHFSCNAYWIPYRRRAGRKRNTKKMGLKRKKIANCYFSTVK